MSTNPTPPVTAERMLAWCVRRDPAAACIVGDLREEYATLARSRSRTSVRRWYWVQVVGIGMRYLGRRSHQSGRTPPPSLRTNRKATPTWDIVMHHIAFAFRGLRRNPGFSAAVVVTLALGIGANATMFGVVDRLLLSPPPHVVDASQLRFLSLSGLGQRSVNSPRAYSFPDYRSIEHHPLLESAAAYAPLRWRTMNAGPDAQRVRVQRATASLFPTLGVRPEHGRFFTDADDITGAPLTAVLSFEFWEREFGRAPDVVGQTLVLGRGRYEVVGVAPAGFSGAELRAVDVWVPLQVSTGVENDWGPLDSRGAWWWRVVVRLERGVTDEAADAQLTAAHRAGIASYLEQGGRLGDDASMGALVHTGSVITARGPTASTTTAVSMWLAGVSLVVLLIACANAANLLLARGIQRRRELAIRVALGAGRKRLTLQLLTEAGMLAGVAALAALLVARWTGGAVRSMLIPGMPLIVPGTNARLFVFVLIAAALTAALAGIVPALQASRTAPADVLRNSTRGNSNAHSTLRGALTIGQITLSVVLLVVAGLFVRSLSHAAEADLGFDHDQIIVVQIEGAAGIGRDRRNELYREAQSRITGLPGVEQAVLATETIPLWGYSEQHDIRTRDNDTIPRVPGGGPYTYSGTEGFVEALGIEVVRG
ncbi:MAG: ABC transporter permease, partial [Gemmatimonadales bacterium]